MGKMNDGTLLIACEMAVKYGWEQDMTIFSINEIDINLQDVQTTNDATMVNIDGVIYVFGKIARHDTASLQINKFCKKVLALSVKSGYSVGLLSFVAWVYSYNISITAARVFGITLWVKSVLETFNNIVVDYKNSKGGFSMVFVNSRVKISDSYGFRLLIMEKILKNGMCVQSLKYYVCAWIKIVVDNLNDSMRCSFFWVVPYAYELVVNKVLANILMVCQNHVGNFETKLHIEAKYELLRIFLCLHLVIFFFNP